ncbi:AAA family ATPase [bacterium]|nr:AAA family ATPase [bacterium]
MNKKIFIAATRQNDGKTVISLGFLKVLKKHFKNVGFMKPVGQKYIFVNKLKVDKDAVLVKKVFDMKDNLEYMNPIAIEEGFTRKYIENPNKDKYIKKIKQSFEIISRDKDFILVEGTGHAGVGSIFDLNNAEVAKILGLPVILISVGGIGRPFDEIALNLSLFKEKGVEVKGVIINKIIPEKKSKVEKYLKKAFKRINLNVIGFVPYVEYLSEPDISQICEAVKGKMISGYKKGSKKVKNIIVGAMTPRHALNYFAPHSLIITPGDREDIILAGLTGYPENDIKGIVLTGGLYPHKTILNLIKKYDIPVIISPKDTYETASSINELVVKITEKDIDKIEIAERLIKENINIEEIMSR